MDAVFKVALVERAVAVVGSQQQLARDVGVAPGLIKRWLAGKAEPDGEQTEQLRVLAKDVPPPENAAPAPAQPEGAELLVEDADLGAGPPADDLLDHDLKREGVDPETGEEPTTAVKPAKALAPQGEPLRVAAQIKACSVSEKTVALGVEVGRSSLDLVAADLALVNARVDVTIAADPGQGELFDGALPPAVKSVADVSKISVGSSTISFRLAFNRETINLDDVACYAGKVATLDFRRVGDAGEEEKAPADEGAFAGDVT